MRSVYIYLARIQFEVQTSVSSSSKIKGQQNCSNLSVEPIRLGCQNGINKINVLNNVPVLVEQ